MQIISNYGYSVICHKVFCKKKNRENLRIFSLQCLPTASLVETKLLLNSVKSDHKLHNAKFCSIDIKDFFLTTPMVRAEYLRIHKRYYLPEFKSMYKLHDKVHKDYIYCKVKKGMYGLKQAAILASKFLLKWLISDGYQPIPMTNGFAVGPVVVPQLIK